MYLPETSLIVAFEAVVRHRNFRRAAGELNVTPSAVSHRLKTLETQLGQPLLIRTTRSVETTAAGAAFFTSVSNVLDDLRTACEAMRAAAEVVTIVTTDSVAACWLIDRLPAIAESTDIEIQILTKPAGFSFDRITAEFAIAYGRSTDWPGAEALLVASETIAPVCHPSMADEITSIDDLLAMPLLGDHNLDVDWPAFAAAAGCDLDTVERIRPATTFNHSHLALRAAASGQGIALAGSPLADDALSRGELVMPVTDSVTTGNGYYLVGGRTRATRATARIRQAFEKRT